MDWTSGYITDVNYVYGYYHHLQPDLLKLACTNVGVAVAPLRGQLYYLELGFGRGLSINIHAAANHGVFWGNDFNPNHANEARALAAASGSGATLVDDSFAELAARRDLPEFDIIVLHGIWSWVSAENRRLIIDLISRRLRVGGIVYVSYNCFPGWAAAVPLKHLMGLYNEFVGAEATDSAAKVDGALKFVRDVVKADALYFAQNPAVAERLDSIERLDRNYAAHEYFAHDWDLMSFSDVERILGEAKLTFVASAHLPDHFDDINFSAEGAKLLADIQHPVLKQSVRDYMANLQFRRDIYIKGLRRLTPLERAEALQVQGFVLTTLPADVPLKMRGAFTEGILQEDIYRPLLEVLAENGHEPRSMRRIAGHKKLRSLSFAQVSEALVALTGSGHVSTARGATALTRARCRALNENICMRSRSTSDVGFLASPVSGSGIAVARMEQLFLLALGQGKKTYAELANDAWDVLQAQGHRVVKAGQAIDSAHENIAELSAAAREFLQRRLPILKMLEIA